MVVNFGETPVIDPPGDDGKATVYLNAPYATTISSTIINTRFEGVTAAQRTNASYWRGGLVLCYNIHFQPRNGVTLIAQRLFAGNSSQLGTTAYPGLTYLTGDWNASFNLFGNGGFTTTGSFITLGSFLSIGRLHFIYDSGFMERIPDAILQQWPGRVSGTLKVLTWHELVGN